MLSVFRASSVAKNCQKLTLSLVRELWSKLASFIIAPFTKVCGSVSLPQKRRKTPPKDTKQLLANYDRVPQNLIQAIETSNTTRTDFVAEQNIAKQPQTVDIYRLAMKAGSDNFASSAVQS
jgi:UDP-glucose 6-dehydrogenase